MNPEALAVEEQLLNRPRLFETRAYASRDSFGEALGLQGREWGLWGPIEVVFDWMDVPVEQREQARAFYRKSITSTRAELSQDQRIVLEELAGIDAALSEGPLVINSREFRTTSYVPPIKLGTILGDFPARVGEVSPTSEWHEMHRVGD